MALPRDSFFRTFKKRVYRRTHISHMRIDRMRLLIRQHSTPPAPLPFLQFCFRPCWPSVSSSRFYSALSPMCTLSANGPISHLSSFFPVRLAGGGDDRRTSRPDIDTIDIFSPEDIEATRLLFFPDEWIAVGKLWSDTLPPHVQLAFTDAQNIPAWMLDVIPKPQVSVLDLCATALPSVVLASTMLVPSSSSPTVFNHTMTKDEVFDHPIFFGGKPVLAAFERLGLEQAWLSGCKSISLNGYCDRYPLWTRNFVHAIQVYRADRAHWEAAQKWLGEAALAQTDADPIETPDIIDECRSRLATVPWRGNITGFGNGVHFTAKHLASFLSDEWLDDEMINAGSDWILRQVGASPRTKIINCLHIQQLRHAHLTETTYLPRTHLDHLIITRGVDIIFIPLHVFGNHWTLLQVNLPDAPPSSTFGLLQWWLNSLLPNTCHLQLVPFELDLPRQLDGFSCGVIVLDLMATILLQNPIWQPQRAAVQRMEWFLCLSADCVSLSLVRLNSYENQAEANLISSLPRQKVIMMAIQLMTPSTTHPASYRRLMPQHLLLGGWAISGHNLFWSTLFLIVQVMENQILMKAVSWLAVVVVAV